MIEIIVAAVGGVLGFLGIVSKVRGDIKCKKLEIEKEKTIARVVAEKEAVIKENERSRALEDGVQCLLRAEIIRSHDKYTERHEIPIYGKEAVDRAYKAYHALGGNDVATELYNVCMKLPVI